MSPITILVYVSFALALFFPIYMALRTDWNGKKRGEPNPAGTSLMAFSLVVSGLLGLTAFRRSGYLPPLWVGIVAYVVFVIMLAVQDVTLVRVTRRQRRRIDRERRQKEREPR